MSYVWKPLKKEGGIGNCVAFLRFSDKNFQSTYSILIPLLWVNTRNTNDIPLFKMKHIFFQNSFFPSAVFEWNKLDLNIHNSESFNIFKKTLLNFMRPSESTVYNCYNPNGVNLLTRLRLFLAHLCEHKFKHCF